MSEYVIQLLIIKSILGQSPTWTLILIAMLSLWLVTVEGAYRLVHATALDTQAKPLVRDRIDEVIQTLSQHHLLDAFVESAPSLAQGIRISPTTNVSEEFYVQGLVRMYMEKEVYPSPTNAILIRQTIQVARLEPKGTDVLNAIRQRQGEAVTKLRLRWPLIKYRCGECGHREWLWRWPLYRRGVNKRLIEALPVILAEARLLQNYPGVFRSVRCFSTTADPVNVVQYGHMAAGSVSPFTVDDTSEPTS